MVWWVHPRPPPAVRLHDIFCLFVPFCCPRQRIGVFRRWRSTHLASSVACPVCSGATTSSSWGSTLSCQTGIRSSSVTLRWGLIEKNGNESSSDRVDNLGKSVVGYHHRYFDFWIYIYSIKRFFARRWWHDVVGRYWGEEGGRRKSWPPLHDVRSNVGCLVVSSAMSYGKVVPDGYRLWAVWQRGEDWEQRKWSRLFRHQDE